MQSVGLDGRRKRAVLHLALFALSCLGAALLALAPAASAQTVGDDSYPQAWTWKAGQRAPDAGTGMWADGKWWLTGYAGLMASNNISSTLMDAHPQWVRNFMVAGALARDIGGIDRNLRFEGELILAAHFGHDNFLSATAVVLARWVNFPWDRWVDTSMAIGIGPSYATEKARYERHNSGDGGSRWLNALIIELTLAPPATPNWAVALRLHHRSGIFGIIDSVASDYFAAGVKFRF